MADTNGSVEPTELQPGDLQPVELTIESVGGEGDGVAQGRCAAIAPRAKRQSTRRPGAQDVFQRASANAGEAGRE